MVHIPTRGDVPVRLGEGVQLVPDYGPSIMDASVYNDPVRFELERERVLAAHWILAGRSDQVRDAGDWLTFEGHGETVVVTRQSDGSLAAFHNVCQHRGPAIVGELVGCGARRFTCPYHGWVYDTRGVVVGVPEREDFDPDHLEARTSLGCVLAEQGDFELAAAAFEGVLRQQPDYADAHWHLAGVLAELDQPGNARQHLLSFLALAPESPWADVARDQLAHYDHEPAGTP